MRFGLILGLLLLGPCITYAQTPYSALKDEEFNKAAAWVSCKSDARRIYAVSKIPLEDAANAVLGKCISERDAYMRAASNRLRFEKGITTVSPEEGLAAMIEAYNSRKGDFVQQEMAKIADLRTAPKLKR